MRAEDEAAQLARELFEARRHLRNAGRALHDEAGSLLSSAGLRLQLLRMDFPQTGKAVAETLNLLERTLESVRTLSQELNSSPPAHLGLQAALTQLVARTAASFAELDFSYNAAAMPPPDASVAIYDAVAAVIKDAAAGGARRVLISVTGAKSLAVRIEAAGWKWPRKVAEAQARRALPAGVRLDTATRGGTNVSIRYASRRPAGG